MADIRVERKAGTKAWVWFLFALIVLALALFLLYQAGYISLADSPEPRRLPLAQLKLIAASLPQEVFHV